MIDEFQTMLDLAYEPSHPIKCRAWEHFKGIGLPNKKMETYRYLPLRKLFEKKYEPINVSEDVLEVPTSLILPECERSLIVLVNGYYVKKLSNTTEVSSKVDISSIQDGMKTYGSFLTNHFVKTLKEEIDPFVALNGALSYEGVFIYVPKDVVIDKPIQILHLVTSQDKSLFLNPRIQVFAGSCSHVTLISTDEILISNGSFINHVADFALEENAHITYIQSLINTPAEVFHFNATRAFLKKNSVFNVFAVSKGSVTSRTDYKATLSGENATSSLHGLWMLEGNNEFHTNILMDHQAPFCKSRQLFKGVLDDSSKSSFEGKILVRQGALKTDAFQLNNNLLLHEDTNAYSKPNLEIYEDDVKASHGATFGQLNPEQLFCLRSRGISLNQAKNLLIFGFCEDLIHLIQVPSLQRIFTEQAKQYRARD